MTFTEAKNSIRIINNRKWSNLNIRDMNMPEVRVVYFLTCKDEILYIGCTVNLKNRMNVHTGIPFSVRIRNKITVYYTIKRGNLVKLENDIINAIPTKFNKQKCRVMEYKRRSTMRLYKKRRLYFRT